MKYKIIFATQWSELAGVPLVEEADHGTVELDASPEEAGWAEELAEKLNEDFDFAVKPEELTAEEGSWGWNISAKAEDEDEAQPIAFICKFPME